MKSSRLISILTVLIMVAMTNNITSYLTQEIAPGVRYGQQTRENGKQRWHILEVNPKKNSVRLEIANKDTPALTTSQLCARYKALATINGGFFNYVASNRLQEKVIKILSLLGYKSYYAKPIFALKKNGLWFSHSSLLTGAIGWKKDGSKAIISAIRTSPNENGVTIFGENDQDITNQWQQMDYILAGTPLLVCNGKIVDYTQTRTSPFYSNNYSRTAIGILPDGTWLLVVVTQCPIAMLAHIMQNLGCVDALNLDGGRSSTMVIDGKVVNDLTSGEYTLFDNERPISNCITIETKE